MKNLSPNGRHKSPIHSTFEKHFKKEKSGKPVNAFTIFNQNAEYLPTLEPHIFLNLNLNTTITNSNVKLPLYVILFMVAVNSSMAENLNPECKHEISTEDNFNSIKKNTVPAYTQNAHAYFAASDIKPKTKIKSNPDIKQFFSEKITFTAEFSSERAITPNEEYEFYYQKGKNYYINKIKRYLQELLATSHYKEKSAYFTEFTIRPTGLQEILHGSDAYTSFMDKTIYIDLKLIHEHEDELIPVLANELQHLLVIMANEKRHNKTIITEDDAKKYRHPFQEKSEKILFLQVANKCLEQFIENINLPLYFQSEIFQIYFRQLAGYEIEPSKNLRETFEKKYMAALLLNAYVSILSPHDQIYEFDTSMASIYVLLKEDDKHYFDPWVQYHRNYLEKYWSQPEHKFTPN